jgi:hypothetical protein
MFLLELVPYMVRMCLAWVLCFPVSRRASKRSGSSCAFSTSQSLWESGSLYVQSRELIASCYIIVPLAYHILAQSFGFAAYNLLPWKGRFAHAFQSMFSAVEVELSWI